MKILLWEIRKIFRPSVIAIVLILYVLAATLIGPLAYFEYSYNSYNGEYNGDGIDGGKSAETVVKDMLMERYGISLEGEELYDFIEFHKEYSENLDKAVSENEYCKKFGITCADDLNMSLYGILGSDYYAIDEDGRLSQVKEDEYSRFFEAAMYTEFEYDGNTYIPEIKQWLDSTVYHIESGFARSGEDYVYYVFHTTILHALGMDIPILFFAAITCAMIAVIPFGVSEKRSGVSDIQYSSKTGKRIYLYKTAAVIISSAIFMAIGVAVALIFYKCLGVDRFDNTMLDSYYGEFDGRFAESLNRVYSQITVAELLKISALSVFVLGVVLCGAVHIVCEKCRNPITAAASCIPLFCVMAFCGYRYLLGCIYPCNHGLTVKWEGLVVLAVLVIAYIIFMLADYLKLRKASEI